MLTFLTHIEHIAHYLYAFASKHHLKLHSRTRVLLGDAQAQFDLFYNAYYQKNIALIHKINNLREEYQFGKCLDLLEQVKGREVIIASYIRELFRLIQVGTSPILSELVDKQAEETRR
ncbi:hypothetical protein HYZ97_04890 [Candidatus Pacearchaeota archaeon]|nr:hypothetical protein [Candidatus Pacearchaeota archaeon]